MILVIQISALKVGIETEPKDPPPTGPLRY